MMSITDVVASREITYRRRTERSGRTNSPPLNAAIGDRTWRSSMSAFIPLGGRPLVMVKAISVFMTWRTAARACGVTILSGVTSVPSTSATTRRTRLGWRCLAETSVMAL